MIEWRQGKGILKVKKDIEKIKKKETQRVKESGERKQDEKFKDEDGERMRNMCVVGKQKRPSPITCQRGVTRCLASSHWPETKLRHFLVDRKGEQLGFRSRGTVRYVCGGKGEAIQGPLKRTK